MFNHNVVLGVDIGCHSVKCAAVEVKTGLIRGLCQAEIQPDRQSIERPLNEEELNERLLSLIRVCQRECHAHGYKIHTAIQGRGIISRYLELPAFTKELSEKEAKTAILSHVSKYVPFPLEEISLSYCKVPPINPEDKKLAIFFIAARKNLVEHQMKLLEGLGLEVERMEVPVVGLARELAKNHELPKDKFFASINIGFGETEILVLRDGSPYYVKEFSLAGRDFTYVFQMNMQSSWEEAEHVKMRYDTLERAPFIEPFIIRWLNEIKDALTYFTKQVSNNSLTVEKIFLSGGMASWKNFNKRVSEYLEIPVVIDGWDRLKCQDSHCEQDPWVYKVAVGLALEC